MEQNAQHEAAHAADPPSAWIVRFAHLIGPGARVLDVACGQGRHSRLFAARGATVVAVDRDADAIGRLAAVPGVEARCADLEAAPWPFAAATFDAVIVTNYLHRPLFGALAAALRPGGVLIYETFMQGNEAYGRPSSPRFLLAPGELLDAFVPPLVVVAFEQGLVARPAVTQRLVAVAPPAAIRQLDPPGPGQIE